MGQAICVLFSSELTFLTLNVLQGKESSVIEADRRGENLA